MVKRTIWRSTALAMVALVCSWGIPGVTTGDDFFDKLKKAAEKAAQQRQQQQQQSQQRQPPSQPQTQQQPRQPSQPPQQPKYKPGGGTPLLPNEKPQPSPDFGTPEGTAKIAAKAGFLDVVGVKLGMPAKEATDALKAHNAGFKPGPITLREYEALPGVIMTPVLHAPNPGGPNATSGDDFNLLITYAPNEAFVWGIVRNMGFGRVEDRPTVEKHLGRAEAEVRSGEHSTTGRRATHLDLRRPRTASDGAKIAGDLQSVLPDLGQHGGIHRRQ